MELTTLCYIENGDSYLMLHRVSKKNDLNAGKWIGVGGHFEGQETPDECLIREVREETGLILTSYKMRGIVTFISGRGTSEYMFLFTADGFVPAGETNENCCEPVGTTDKPCCKSDEASPTPTPLDILLSECSEGELAWIRKKDVPSLNLWEGDRIFLNLLLTRDDFFLLKLVYDENDRLTEAVLDGTELAID